MNYIKRILLICFLFATVIFNPSDLPVAAQFFLMPFLLKSEPLRFLTTFRAALA